MKKVEFLMQTIEGDVSSVSDMQSYKLYKKHIGQYFSKQRELGKIAFPPSCKTDPNGEPTFDFGENTEPKINVEEEMKKQGYFSQSFYSYSEKDGQNGHGIYETPFAKIETFMVRDALDFETTDGQVIADKRIVITLK